MIGDPDGPVVVLSPHLDDAVLSAWSVLRSTPPGGVQVVVVFAGIPPEGTTGRFDPIFGVTDSAALVRRRREEDREALAAVGIVPIHLDHLDDQYRTGPVDPTELVESIDEVARGASVLVAPTGLGNHPDHLAVRTASMDLAASPEVGLWYYADMPYATNLGWPAWVTGEQPDPHLAPEAAWSLVMGDLDEGRLEPVATRFDDAEREAKLAACRCYRSQWPALEGGPNHRISNPAVSSFEVRWEVHEPDPAHEPSGLRGPA